MTRRRRGEEVKVTVREEGSGRHPAIKLHSLIVANNGALMRRHIDILRRHIPEELHKAELCRPWTDNEEPAELRRVRPPCSSARTASVGPPPPALSPRHGGAMKQFKDIRGENDDVSFVVLLFLVFFMLATSLLLSSRCCGDDAQHFPEITSQSKTATPASPSSSDFFFCLRQLESFAPSYYLRRGVLSLLCPFVCLSPGFCKNY